LLDADVGKKEMFRVVKKESKARRLAWKFKKNARKFEKDLVNVEITSLWEF